MVRMKPIPANIPEKWSWHYRALERIRDTLVRESEEHAAEARSGPDRGGTDAGDVARELTEHDTLMAELRQEQTELVEVEAALERIRRGTYGSCEATGQPIAAARLRAVPWTRLSLAAAETREQRR
jgi:DnaK suppressor protein